MTEPGKSDSQRCDDARLDNALAEFADRLLNSSAPNSLSPLWDEAAEEELDLRRLQKTVLQLRAAIDTSLPEPAVQRRIRQQIKQEWNRYQPARPSVLHRLEQAVSPVRRPALAFGLMCLALALLAGVLAILPEGAQITGAAGQSAAVWVILAAAGVVFGLVVLIYFLRRRP